MHCKSKTHYIPSPCIESQCQKGGKPKHIVFISALNLTVLSNVKKESKFLEIPWNTSLSKNRRLCRTRSGYKILLAPLYTFINTT